MKAQGCQNYPFYVAESLGGADSDVMRTTA